jgi:hypothetical protein
MMDLYQLMRSIRMHLPDTRFTAQGTWLKWHLGNMGKGGKELSNWDTCKILWPIHDGIVTVSRPYVHSLYKSIVLTCFVNLFCVSRRELVLEQVLRRLPQKSNPGCQHPRQGHSLTYEHYHRLCSYGFTHPYSPLPLTLLVSHPLPQVPRHPIPQLHLVCV